MNTTIHPAEKCVAPDHHERWSVWKHVGDYGRSQGDIEATYERGVARQCIEKTGEWAMVATGFATPEDAKAWAMGEVFALNEGGTTVWKVRLWGKVLPIEWQDKGAAQAGLETERRREWKR